MFCWYDQSRADNVGWCFLVNLKKKQKELSDFPHFQWNPNYFFVLGVCWKYCTGWHWHSSELNVWELPYLLLACTLQQYKESITIIYPFRFWNNRVVWKECWFWMGRFVDRTFQIWDWELVMYLNSIYSFQIQSPIFPLKDCVKDIFITACFFFPYSSLWRFSIHLYATQAFIYIIRIPETCSSWLWHSHITNFVSSSIMTWH